MLITSFLAQRPVLSSTMSGSQYQSSAREPQQVNNEAKVNELEPVSGIKRPVASKERQLAYILRLETREYLMHLFKQVRICNI